MGGEIRGGNRRFCCPFLNFSNVLLLQWKAISDKWVLSCTWWKNSTWLRKNFPKISVQNVQRHKISQAPFPTVLICPQHLFWCRCQAIKRCNSWALQKPFARNSSWTTEDWIWKDFWSHFTHKLQDERFCTLQPREKKREKTNIK